MNHKVLFFLTATLITPTTWAATPESGWWYNPAEPGRGFNIEVQHDAVFIAAMVYNEAGIPIWYSGSGKLKDSTITLTLRRFEGGQCIGCAYTEPTSSKGVDPVTVHFTSGTRGTLTWQGETVPIKRFNFALGKGLERLLGEWVITIGSPSLPVYFGARLTYRGISIHDGIRYAEGSISGSPSNLARVSVFKDPQATGYQYFGMTDSSESYYDYYLFNFVGLNKITGKTITIEKTASQEEVTKSLVDGRFFVGYRNLDKTDVTAHRATLPSSLQNSRSTAPEQSDNQRENLAVEMIAHKVYVQKEGFAN